MTNISFTTASGKKVRFRARHQKRHIRRNKFGRKFVAGKKKKKIWMVIYTHKKTGLVKTKLFTNPFKLSSFVGRLHRAGHEVHETRRFE